MSDPAAVADEVRISADPDRATELIPFLARWLRDETGLRDSEITRPVSSPRPGELGPVGDVLVVALGSGGAGAVLAHSLVTWIGTRRTDLTLTVTTSRGSVDLHTVTMADPAALVSEIAKILPPAEEPGGDEPA